MSGWKILYENNQCISVVFRILFLCGFSGSSLLAKEHSDVYAKWTLEEKISQLFIFGFRNLDEVKKLKPGGVILFSWNLPDLKQTKSLTRNLQYLAKNDLRAPLFIATDHEGGTVLRLKKGITQFPDALTVGSLNDPFQAFRFGKLMGLELSLLGINMNLAPVMDLGNAKSFLANRVWGDRPEAVTPSTLGFIDGSLSAGVVPVAKHFPGHGLSSMDSHFGLPVMRKSFSRLWNEELEPFRRAIAHGIPAMMTAHVEISSIDRKPASLSKRFVTDILRSKLGFQGIVITDDLEMAGVRRGVVPKPELLALEALEAGSDMVMIVWSKSVQEASIRAMKEAVDSGRFPLKLIHEKLDRILSAKERYLSLKNITDNPYWESGLHTEESQKLVREMSARAVSWLTPNRENLLNGLSRSWDQQWNVFVPTSSVYKQWQHFRPNDHLATLPRRPGIESLHSFRQDLESKLKELKPVIVITGPRALASEDLFGELRSILNRHIKQTPDKQLVLPRNIVVWVHQGAQPIRLNDQQTALFRDVGIISLNGAGESNTEALTDQLKMSKHQATLTSR